MERNSRQYHEQNCMRNKTVGYLRNKAVGGERSNRLRYHRDSFCAYNQGYATIKIQLIFK